MNSKPNSSATSLLWLYDGRRLVGFVLARGRAGFEAFDRNEQSRGLYPTQQLAIAAISAIDETETV
jgi:hypothetical protein